jgi:sulfhydrogenase subunit alpha
MTQDISRTLRLENLSRVEGEGGISLCLEGGQVRDVQLNIFEPPRFFEAFLRGRHIQEVPDIVARICGICPVAYQMSSVHALENGLGIMVDPAVRALRRLLYCAEWIESHALHIYLLHAPDFLGYESAVSMAQKYGEELRRGLALKKIGNHLLEVLGGRAIHPVSVCIGGFYKIPRREEMLKLRGDLDWALKAAMETVTWVCRFDFPDINPDYEFVCLSHSDEYAMNEGTVVSSRGLKLTPSECDQAFLEEHVRRSTALHSVRTHSGTSYFVGPLARLNLNHDKLFPQAKLAWSAAGLTLPVHNPYISIVARAVELVHVCEEALSIIESYREPQRNYLEYVIRKGEGCAATEAPRGILFHRYRFNEQGLIEFAKIVPPTSQNLRRMEDDLRLLVPTLMQRPDEEIVRACEHLVRNYDPCISCSTHFMKVRIRRN